MSTELLFKLTLVKVSRELMGSDAMLQSSMQSQSSLSRHVYAWFYRDVHVGLIGYSEEMKWPQHYTLNSNTNIEGEVKHMEFYEPQPTLTLQVST